MRVSLQAADGYEFGAEFADSKDPAGCLGGIVLLHEIFGLTPYIESVVEYWSGLGYQVIAPSLFDRQECGAVISYDDPKRGLALAEGANRDELLLDIEAARAFLNQQSEPIAVVGICFGGGLAYRAACELNFQAGVVIYGTRLLQYRQQSPKCAVQFHFGEFDKHGSDEVLGAMRKAAPDALVHSYKADHGFDRKSGSDEEKNNREQLRNNIASFLAAEFVRATV